MESIDLRKEAILARLTTLIATLALGLVAAGCVTSRPVEPAALVGSWRSSVQFKTGPFAEVTDLVFMLAFNIGGTMTESSNYDGYPPGAPAYGVWRQLGPREFEAHYEFFSPAPLASLKVLEEGGGWTSAGHGVLTERITLSEDGRTYTSTLQHDAFDAQGHLVEEDGGEAECQGERIGF
jgi:hypothetical protein